MIDKIKEKAISVAPAMIGALTAIITVFGAFIGATFHDPDFLAKVGAIVFVAVLFIEFLGLTIFVACAIIIAILYIRAIREASK